MKTTALLSILAIATLGACDSGGDSSVTAADTSTGDTAVGGDTAGGTDTAQPQADGTTPDASTTEDVAPPVLLDNGQWYASVNIVPLGDFRLNLQLDLQVTGEPGAAGELTSLILRAVGKDGISVSGDLAKLENLPIDAEGKFVAELLDVILPAEYTVTGSDLLVDVTFHGQIANAAFVCGDVTGNVDAIGLDLEGSTFAAVPWGQQTDPPQASCDDTGETPQLEHIATCPALTAGHNTGFETAGESRSFYVYLPADHDPSKEWPIVFLYHGLGGDAPGIVADSKLDEQVDQGEFILVVPESLALPIAWKQETTDENTPDLFLFDDVLKCAEESFNVDQNRIYVTGMSGGGLFTGFLSAMRSDVIAASAPVSGGLMINFPKPADKYPSLLTWGGDTDIAKDQDFATFAKNLIADLLGNGQFVVQCEHALGHEWPAEMTPAIVQFFLDHPKGTSPEPYAAGLPAVFPGYCEIATP